MQQQLEAYKPWLAAQLKATETQTLELPGPGRASRDRSRETARPEEVVNRCETSRPAERVERADAREDGRVDGARRGGVRRRARSSRSRLHHGREANRARHHKESNIITARSRNSSPPVEPRAAWPTEELDAVDDTSAAGYPTDGAKTRETARRSGRGDLRRPIDGEGRRALSRSAMRRRRIRARVCRAGPRTPWFRVTERPGAIVAGADAGPRARSGRSSGARAGGAPGETAPVRAEALGRRSRCPRSRARDRLGQLGRRALLPGSRFAPEGRRDQERRGAARAASSLIDPRCGAGSGPAGERLRRRRGVPARRPAPTRRSGARLLGAPCGFFERRRAPR